MFPKIVIASDSFKGSLTSSEVAAAVSEGVRRHYPSAEIIRINVADGGEGTTAAILDCTEGDYVTLEVSDPLGRKIEASYGLIDHGRTAVIEVAAASGLTLLSPPEHNPMNTSTFGTGEMIADALRRGCRKFMIGLGGSATNDGGMGMLSALGYEFYDADGKILDGCGASLGKIKKFDGSAAVQGLDESEFIVACDVDNPLYGHNGAAHIFAPQKGADMSMAADLDKGLRNFSEIMKTHFGKDVSGVPGAGAAGGLGGAFIAFMNARLTPGIEMVLDAVKFDDLIHGADMIITGEGRIDRQTSMGKVPYGVLKRAKEQGIRTIALGGSIEECVEIRSMGFDALIQITPAGMPLETAMQPEIAKSNIAQAVATCLPSILKNIQNISPYTEFP